MDLPEAFVRNVTLAFGEPGRRFLVELPNLLDRAARRWQLTLGEPFLLSYNYVCAASRADGLPLVLKIGVPNRELTSEAAALRLYAGQGACRLLESDPQQGLLLLERVLPGRMLHEAGTDDQQTGIAADLLSRLWRAAPEGEPLIPLDSWFAELGKLRPRFAGGTGPYSRRLVEAVEAELPGLLADPEPAVVLHGDYHHYNILESERGWLAIDPKGVTGPRGYEVGPYLLNPWGLITDPAEVGRRAGRRLAIFAERLALPRPYLRAWAVCFSLLSSYWDLQENGTGGEYSAACGEILLDLPL